MNKGEERMKVRITFLGTSHGLPEKGRYCSCTMLEIGDSIYIVDMGAPFIDIAKRDDIDYDKVKSIFITHFHGDHFNGIVGYLQHVKWFCPNCKTQSYLPDIILKNALQPILDDRADESNRNIALHLYEKGLFYDDGVVKVEAIPTAHMSNINRATYAFEITAGGKKLLFTGDLSDDFSDFPEIAEQKEFDLIVCELTHFSVERAVARLNAARTKKLVFNHVREDKVQSINKNKNMIVHNYTIARDGDVIVI